MKTRGIQVAHFEMRASEVGDTVRIVSKARLTGVARFVKIAEAQAAAILDRASAATRTALVEFRVQGRFRRVALRFQGDRVRGIVGGAQGDRAFQRRSIAGLRPLSSETLLLALRSWRPARGERALAAVIGTRNLWLIEFRARQPRVLEGPTGERRAQELVGVARQLAPDGTLDATSEPGSLSVFISDDAARLPLRVETSIDSSAVILELTDHSIN